MASYLKNARLLDQNRLNQMVRDRMARMRSRTREAVKRQDDNGGIDLNLPEVIAILPIRNTVAFPGTVTPLAVGRESSKVLLADAEHEESLVGLLTQRKREHRQTRL